MHHIRNQILAMNGFDATKYPEAKCAELLEHLLKESEDTFGHERQVREHAEPLLSKYFYIQQKESTDSVKKFKRDELQERLSDARSIKTALEGKAGSSSDSAAVKSENPKVDQAIGVLGGLFLAGTNSPKSLPWAHVLIEICTKRGLVPPWAHANSRRDLCQETLRSLKTHTSCRRRT